MTPATKNMAAKILPLCRSLDDAERRLLKLQPIQSVAMRWGLFDGYRGRPSSLAGLCPSDREAPKAIEMDYKEGVSIGREISMRREPG